MENLLRVLLVSIIGFSFGMGISPFVEPAPLTEVHLDLGPVQLERHEAFCPHGQIAVCAQPED